MQIRFLGALEVRTPDGVAKLPPSRKTRGLLAYLALSGRPHSRTALAEMFWGEADDPKGGLRWGLSKLRGLIGDRDVIASDRQSVWFEAGAAWLDLPEVERRAAAGLEELQLEALLELERCFRGELMEGLDLEGLHGFAAWLVARRAEAHTLHRRIAEELVQRHRDEPEGALAWWHRLAQIDPHDDEVRAGLCEALWAAGRGDEAEREYRRALQELESRGANTYALRVARRSAGRRREAPTGGAARPERREPLFGRREELAELQRSWEATLDGRGSTILIAGEPGIGKSHLIAELMTRVRDDDHPVLRGACISAEGASAYAPLAEALADVARSAAADGAAADPRLAQVMPVLDGVALDGTRDRYAVFRAVSELLVALAEPDGALLVIEDLQWSDAQTLLLLAHLARHTADSRLMVLASYRDTDVPVGHPLFGLIGALEREGARRLELGRLAESDATAMVAALLRQRRPEGAPGPQLDDDVRRIHERTAGHPFFIDATVRHLAEDGLPDGGPGADSSLPQDVRELVGRRLAGLSSGCNRMLMAASAIVGAIEWPVLVRLVDGDEEALLDQLDEALASQVLCERRGARAGTYEFGHDLVRQTIYDGMATSRRVLLHRKLVDAIAHAHRRRIDSQLVALAHHAHQAAQHGEGLERLVDYSVKAGRASTAQLAYEQAAGIYQRALDVLEEQGGSDAEADRSRLHTLAGQSRATLCSWQQACDHFDRALALAPADADAERARLLLLRMHARYRTRRTEGSEADLKEALRLAEGASEPRLAAAARGFLVTLGLATEALDPGAAFGVAELEQADIEREPVLGQALQHEPLRLYWAGRFAEAADYSRRLIDVTTRIDDPWMRLNLLPTLALSLSAQGHYRESEERFADARRLGGEHGIEPMLARAIAMSAGNCVDLGDAEGYRARATEAHELALRVAFQPVVVSTRIDLCNVAIMEGDVDAAASLLAQTEQDVSFAAGWHGWVWALRVALAAAKLDVLRGDWPRALESCEAALAHARRCGRAKSQVEALWQRACALEASGRRDEAADDLAAAVADSRRIGHVAYLLRSHRLQRQLLGQESDAGEAGECVKRLEAELDGDMRTRFLARWQDAP